MPDEKSKIFYNEKVLLSLIVLFAFIVRLFFVSGLVFSDDAYYNFLSQTLLDGKFAYNYIGYPIFLTRILQTLLTAASFAVFGVNEFSAIFFPFLFSIVNVPLVYLIALELTESKKIALTAALLTAFFPTDVIFAGINFVDLQSAFLINVGIYFLIKSVKNGNVFLSLLAGLFFFLSFLYKENVYFMLIFLSGLAVYDFFKKKDFTNVKYSLLVFFILLVAEGVVYLFAKGDPLYRFHIFSKNYEFCYYDFFPYTILPDDYSTTQYIKALFNQIFIINLKSLFLRRLYLFIPLIALIESVLILKEEKKIFTAVWFLVVAGLMVGFTTSLTDYKPLDLSRNWYVYIILTPAIILAAKYFERFEFKVKSAMLILFLVASIFMDFQYEKFFDVKRKNRLKTFVSELDGRLVYTDHHTKYGLDLIEKNPRTKIVSFTNLPAEQVFVIDGSVILWNENEIEELRLQGNSFPKLKSILSERDTLLMKIGFYDVYQIRRKTTK